MSPERGPLGLSSSINWEQPQQIADLYGYVCDQQFQQVLKDARNIFENAAVADYVRILLGRYLASHAPLLTPLPNANVNQFLPLSNKSI